jgi:type I restriction enzyme S subunit
VFFVSEDFWPLNTTLYVRDFHGNEPQFIAHLLRTIDFHSHSGKSGVPGVNRNDLHELVVQVPPIAEQRAIAAALSDVDALLAKLDQLIAKKRDLKQAAMQQLLTGQTRLPGFEGEWKTARLDEVGVWRGGMTPSMKNQSYWAGGTVPWISSGDVKDVQLKETGLYVTPLAIKDGAAPMVPKNSIIVVARSGILRKYLPVAITVVPMAINQDIKALVPSSKFHSHYLLHALIGSGERILASCLKAGTTVESIEYRWLKAFTIPAPSLNEQTAIAAVLSHMDTDLAALEARRDKTRALKQGMMQELLTGRIRLL